MVNKKIRINKNDIKKIIISFLLVIAMVVQFSFLSYLFKALAPESSKNKDNLIMSYTSSGNIDYKVFLKENNFIDNEYLNAGEAYILDLIDYVRLTPVYNFKSTSKTNVTGTNKLVAKLKVYYKESSDKNNNPEVMNKEKTLDEKVMNFNDDKYTSLGSYDLYLNEYLDMLKEFQSEVKIAVDGYLDITYESSFDGKVGGASYSNKYDNTVRIPLSNSVVKIESPKSEAKESNVYEADLVKTNKTVMSYIVIANIVVFIIICFLLKKLFSFTNKSEYQRKLSKILKNYDDIIVNTSSIVDVKKYKVIKIEEFKEILNLSRELLLPIMNYEKIKDKETWFYVIKDDILYMHVVSEKKLELKTNEEDKVKKEEKRKRNNS